MSAASMTWALGAMSGTSLDGVDAAMVQTDGAQIKAFGPTGYRPYSDIEREILGRALGKTEGPEVDQAAHVVESAHLELLSDFGDAEIIGFHGQTTFHAPDDGQTCQIGKGHLLASALNTPVVWDFRSADVRLGGQGAPLVPFYHFALAKHLGFTEPVAFLNIGGVANLTWLDPSFDHAEMEGACLAFDTGPGNALIDDVCRERFGQPMDKDGAMSRSGEVHIDLLEQMLGHRPYFETLPPKSLDRNDFSDWSDKVASLSGADAVATLAAGTAGAIVHGMDHCPTPPARLLVAGGGRKNAGLMEMIDGMLDIEVQPVEAFGLDGDMLEAQAFAFLAVRVKRGLPTSAPGTTGVAAPVGGGILSEPGKGKL